MQETIEKMLKIVKSNVNDLEFINRHKSSAKDFTRNRNLSFEDITNFVLGNIGTSMDFEVLNFCEGRLVPCKIQSYTI